MLLWREAAEYPVFIITESSIIMLFIHFSVPADVMHGKWFQSQTYAGKSQAC